MKSVVHITCALLFCFQIAHADILLCEDFEDASITYTTNIAEASDGEFDFFGRVAIDGISISPSVNFSNTQGNGYFAAMDTDSLDGNPDTGVLTFDIDISGFNNLSFSGLFAEDVADDGNPDWDANTGFVARYSIDGGDSQNLVAFEAQAGTNTAPALDTDFDGIGDGPLLNSTFTEYTMDITEVGNLLSLELTLNNFDAGDEDIAFDNIYLTGDQITAPVPLPGAMWLFISAIAGVMSYQRKTIE